MLFGRRKDAGARAIERRIGYRFSDPRLLEVALTHRSYANEQGLDEHYERLEFLGDAVLDLASAEWLFRRYPEDSEGELSRLKSYLVSEPVLAALGATLELGGAIRLGVGEERSGGREKPSLLCDVVEALIGAVYLDGGLVEARRVTEQLLEQARTEGSGWRKKDAKSALQEWLQSSGGAPPTYRLTGAHGPDHRKVFEVEVLVGERSVGRGSGRSKKLAEQEAAEAALENLEAFEE